MPFKSPNMPEIDFPGFIVPGAKIPNASPNLYPLASEQMRLATDFRSNMPAMRQKLQADYVSQARRELANKMADVTKSYNSRGLLKSGMKTGATASARYGAMADIDQGKLGINNQLENQANELENNVLNTSYGIGAQGLGLGPAQLQGTQNQMNSQFYQNQANQEMWNSGLGGLVNLGTSVFGRNSK